MAHTWSPLSEPGTMLSMYSHVSSQFILRSHGNVSPIILYFSGERKDSGRLINLSKITKTVGDRTRT